MTAYVNYIALLDTLDEVLTNAHLRQDYEVETYVDTFERGRVVSAEVTIPNPGLALLSPTQKQYVAIIESPDGTIAHARVLLKGWIVPEVRVTGQALGSNKSTLHVEAAPIDLQNQKWTYVLANLYGNRPTFDELFEDMSFDRPDNALDAMSAHWFVDPATHALSVVDDVDGDGSVSDIEDSYDHKSLKIDWTQPPVQRVKLTIQAEFTQHAYGQVNISAKIVDPGVGYITSMDAEHFESQARGLPTRFLDYANGSGWTHSPGDDVAFGYWAQTGYIFSGQQIDASFQGIVGYNLSSDGTYYVAQYGNVIDRREEMVNFWYMTYTYLFHWMTFDYSQPRRETVTIFLDYPIQPINGVTTELDLGVKTLKDLNIALIPNPVAPPEPDPNGDYILPYAPYVQVKPYDPLAIYNTGDLVTLGQLTYQCQHANTVFPFFDLTGGIISHKNWLQVPNLSPILDERTPSFFDTQRGQYALMHGLLRCEATARRRSLAMEASFDCDWEVGVNIPLTAKIRFTFFDWSTRTGRAAVGTIKARKRTISGPRNRKFMTFTLSIAVGDGSNVAVPQVGPQVYVDPTTSAEAYYDNLQSALGLSQAQLQAKFISLYTFQDGYPDVLLGSFGIGRIAWTYGAQPLIAPVDAFSLGDADYAVYDVIRQNEATYQYARAIQYGYMGWDPRDAITENPTMIQVIMKDIGPSAVLERLYDVAAQVGHAPRGIDLVNGGEP